MALIPPLAAAGGHLTLPDKQHILGLGYDYRTNFDYGHLPTAWYNLGLHGLAAVPNQVQFEDYCCRLIRHVRDMRTRVNTCKRRFRIIVMAIKTISGQSRAYMNPSDPHIDFPLPGDLPGGTTWAARFAELAAAGGSLPPFAAPVIDAINSKAVNRVEARHLRKLAYRRTQARGGPSARERLQASSTIREAEWELANRYTSFVAVNSLGLQRMTPVTTNKEADNSLWHALSYQINGAGATTTSSPRLGLRGGRREKAWLYHYFTEVLHDPGHIRHRLYTRLAVESQSVLQEGHNFKTTAQMPDWGELSMLRCLAVNSPHGGPPKWPQFEGIFQLISDFWRQEVVVFVGSKGLAGFPVGGSWRTPYRMRVFGKRAYGTSTAYPNGLTGHGQLLFVTDDDMQHFDAVRYDGPGPVFDTAHLDEDGRYSQFGMAFLDLPGFIPPVSRAPADIPPTTNGIAPGAPGHVAYGRPADDPRFRLPDTHPLVVCYEHDRDAVETRPGFGDGRKPRLANLVTMGSWTTEQGAPGVDARPTVFEPWLTTSGCYRTTANRTAIQQGRYENTKACLIAKYTPEFEGQQVTRPRTIV